MRPLKSGAKVKFASDKVSAFIEETSGVSEEITKYQTFVLAGINQVGIVKEVGDTMSTISFNDGWDLPVPNKYLVILSD